MLELIKTEVVPNDRIQVEAKLDGRTVRFSVAQEVVEDVMRLLVEGDMAECIDHIEKNWPRFASALEPVVRRHGDGVLITSDIFRP